MTDLPMAKQVMDALQLIQSIKDALGTAEDGDALVEVARNAHRAEQKIARIYILAQEEQHSQILSQLIMDVIDESPKL